MLKNVTPTLSVVADQPLKYKYLLINKSIERNTRYGLFVVHPGGDEEDAGWFSRYRDIRTEKAKMAPCSISRNLTKKDPEND